MERYSQLLGLGSVKCGRMVLVVDRQSLWSTTGPSTNLSDTNPTWICLESISGVLCERPANNLGQSINWIEGFFFDLSDSGCGTIAVYGCIL